MLVNFTSEDSEGQARVKAFAEALQKLGVAEGSNVLTETRFASDDANLYHRYSEELVALAPDVLLASTSASRPLRGCRRGFLLSPPRQMPRNLPSERRAFLASQRKPRASARGLVVADQRDGLRGHVPIAASSSFSSATVRSIMLRAKSSIGSPAMR